MPAERPIVRRRRADVTPTSPAQGPEFLDLPLASDPSPEPELPAPVAPPDQGPRPDHGSRHRRRARRSRGRGFPALLLAVAGAVPLGVALGFFLKPEPGVPVLSTDLVTFGEVMIGGEAEERTLRLQNDGEAKLDIVAWTIENDPAGAFRVVPDPGCTGALPSAAACTVSLAFTPGSVGSVQGRLVLRTVSDGRPTPTVSTVPLLGSGIAADLVAGPEILDFPATDVGYRGERRSVFLHNRGRAPVRVEAVSLQGLGSADFVLHVDRCSATVLPEDGRCEVGFEFVPTADGERTATLWIRADSPLASEPPRLVGEGLAKLPRLVVEPLRIDFGAVRVGARGEPRTVVLRNDGTGPMTVRSVRPAPPETGSAPLQTPELLAGFPVDDLGCAESILAPGESCSLRVGFEPLLRGPLGMVVRIDHSAAAAAHLLPVMGRGTAPSLQLSAERLSFGKVPVGSPSPWQALELRNAGDAELRALRVSLRGTDARFFEISSEGCARAPVPPGQSCTVQVRFTARRPGPHRAEVHLRHDAEDGLVRLPLNGIGGG